jgi:hypothetical protein
MPTSPATTARRRTGAETYHIERVTLEPIDIADPEHELIESMAAARLLGVHKTTITGYVDRGTLSTIRRSGSSRRWLLRAEVEALVASRAAE